MEAKGEVERERALRQVDNIALRGVDEDFVGKKIKTKFFKVDFFAVAELSGGVLELGNPEEVGGEMLDFALFVVFGELLFVIVEAGGETAFGVIVHFAGANLELDDFFALGDDGSMERLITVLFRDGDIIFNAAVHGGIKGVEQTHGEIARGDVGDDDAEGGEIVNFAHVLVVFGELFMEGIDGFDAAGNLKLDFFLV